MYDELGKVKIVLHRAAFLYACLVILGIMVWADQKDQIMELERERNAALADLLYEMLETRDVASRKRLSRVLRVAFKRDLKEDSCLRRVLTMYAQSMQDSDGRITDAARRSLRVQLAKCREQ